MEKDFIDYLRDERNRFVKVAVKYDTHEYNELRTAIDSLLIAYDQAREKLVQPKGIISVCKICNDEIGTIMADSNGRCFRCTQNDC